MGMTEAAEEEVGEAIMVSGPARWSARTEKSFPPDTGKFIKPEDARSATSIVENSKKPQPRDAPVAASFK